jgi:hypothetical protein
MPWSNQGGGGPLGGGKGPWRSGPQSSGPTPPDLEELLRRCQDKFRTVVPVAILVRLEHVPIQVRPRSTVMAGPVQACPGHPRLCLLHERRGCPGQVRA